MNTSLWSSRHNRPYRAALAAAVLLAWLATPLRADVIDDLSGPKKFGFTGLGGHPEILPPGQLRYTWPDGNGYMVCFWRRNYLLPEGRPVEFKVDLVSASDIACSGGLLVALQSPVHPNLGQVYAVSRRHNWVALTKYRDLGPECAFLDVQLPSETAPVTMSLTLTRLGDSLKLGVKVVLRDQPEQVIFEREVTDGPGHDPTATGTDPGPPLPGAVTAVGLNADPGSSGAPELVFDNVACSDDAMPSVLAISRQGAASLRLDWNGGCVPLAADTILGPWKPCGEPLDGANPYGTTVPLRAKEQFFRLVEGVQVQELFDGSIVLWEVGSVAPGDTHKPALARVGSHGCRIRGTGENNQDFLLRLILADSGSWYQDCVASLDIVSWEKTMEDAAFGIILRAKPLGDLWFCTTEGLPEDRYAGLLTFKKSGSPSESVLALSGPHGEVLESWSFPAVDPARQYRVQFWAVGDRLTLELFDLADPDTPMVTCAATDSRIPKGMAAMYGTKSATGTYEVTINRYLITGVSP